MNNKDKTLEFKGTKGEWKVSDSNTYGRKTIDFENLRGYIDIWYHNGADITKEEALANAKLVASAPKLLEALQLFMKEYNSKGNIFDYDMNIAREAINKALK